MSAEHQRRQGQGQADGERPAIELKVEYRRLNTFFFDYTRNISKGGTFIRTARPLPVGTRFRFKLVVPGLAEPLLLVGEVRWVRGPEEASAREAVEPGMGIRLLHDDERQRRAMEEVVERLMVASLGPLIAAHLRGLAWDETPAGAARPHDRVD